MVYLNKTTSNWYNDFQSQTQSQISKRLPRLDYSLILPRKQRWLDLGKPSHAPAACVLTRQCVHPCGIISQSLAAVGHTSIYIAI